MAKFIQVLDVNNKPFHINIENIAYFHTIVYNQCRIVWSHQRHDIYLNMTAKEFAVLIESQDKILQSQVEDLIQENIKLREEATLYRDKFILIEAELNGEKDG